MDKKEYREYMREYMREYKHTEKYKIWYEKRKPLQRNYMKKPVQKNYMKKYMREYMYNKRNNLSIENVKIEKKEITIYF